MKRSTNYSNMLLATASLGLILTGCNAETSVTEGNGDSQTSLVSTTQGECCGKCKQAETVAVASDNCCGKCGGEGDTNAKPAGCCGSCGQAESVSGRVGGCCAAVAKTGQKQVDGCTANCKCDSETAATSQAGDNSSAAATQVNSRRQDRDIFHFLLENHDQVTRTVTELENGVRTVTESSNADIAKKIKEHVASMHGRVQDGRPLRMWDELYQEIFKHHEQIKMEIEDTENGVAVTETSDDEYVVQLIQQHAKVVTGFTKRGFDEAHENHVPPKK